jgi:hypothetical protein
MIDFNGSGFFARLAQTDNNEFFGLISDYLVNDEKIFSTYKSVRDGLVFTSKRIISINIQGITGKKKDITSIPYSKISCYSLETAGTLDLDTELEIYITAVGKVKFSFVGHTDVSAICRLLSIQVL